MQSVQRSHNFAWGGVVFALFGLCGAWQAMTPGASFPSGRAPANEPLVLTYIANSGVQGDAPGKIDQVRRFYEDIFLLLPGMPARILGKEKPSLQKSAYGQTPPGAEAVRFWPEILTAEKHPHGHLAFSPDGGSVFWSAMLQDGPEQTIFWSALTERHFPGPPLPRSPPLPETAARPSRPTANACSSTPTFLRRAIPPRPAPRSATSTGPLQAGRSPCRSGPRSTAA